MLLVVVDFVRQPQDADVHLLSSSRETGGGGREVTLRFVGVNNLAGVEITIFDKLRETLWRQEISGSFDQRQPWGSLDARLEWSQYLHDFSKYRLEADGEVSVRLFRGLSVFVEGSASRIRDQLSQPRRDATPEEVLLRLRELQSGYQFRFQTGFTYSFGSIFNNVVNPRFGG